MAQFTLYSANKADFRLNDMISSTVKLAALTSTYAPNSTTSGHALWSDIGLYEIASTSNGYTLGGATLPSVAKLTSTNGYTFSSGAVTWNALGVGIPEHFYYVMYISGVLWGKTDPLIGYLFANSETTGMPVTAAGTPLSVTPQAGGWFDLV